MNSIGDLKGKNILLLQGPMGDFFKRLDDAFRNRGAKTYKIGFNFGDQFFSNRDNYLAYRGKAGKEWKKFISKFLIENNINKIFLFGDCRHYQSISIKVAMQNNIEVFVFEEGYVRPDYITMEKWGVNDYSHLSRDAKFYHKLKKNKIKTAKPANQSKFKMVYSATVYYALSNALYFRYPYYIHHREFSAVKEAFFGVRGAIRKLYYPLIDEKYLPLLQRELKKKFYFVPLQTHNDFQILQHSDFRSIEKFIITVLESFAKYAPQNTYLLFKHHPVDRGRKNYKKFIIEQAKLLNIKNRVIIVHDLHLPTILKLARATVTVNSTVGLTSISYGIPTITLGRAVYDIKGLTCKDMELDTFWKKYKKPDKNLYEKFRNYLIENTQLNGSFYGMFPEELTSS
jgi:capsular polysaccharide export protein